MGPLRHLFLAAFLLPDSGYVSCAVFVFPVWVLLVSGYILMDNQAEAARIAPSGNEREVVFNLTRDMEQMKKVSRGAKTFIVKGYY